jgi:hypothetical protein
MPAKHVRAGHYGCPKDSTLAESVSGELQRGDEADDAQVGTENDDAPLAVVLALAQEMADHVDDHLDLQERHLHQRLLPRELARFGHRTSYAL